VKVDTKLNVKNLWTFDDQKAKSITISREIDGYGGEGYEYFHWINTSNFEGTRTLNFSFAGLEDGITAGVYMDDAGSGSDYTELVIYPNESYLIEEHYYLSPMIEPDQTFNLTLTVVTTL
jgi:hypothetical protein